MKQPLRVAMVAGEMSGDLLGAELMAALQQARPDVQFLGIGGEKMMAAGFNSLFPMERLSVMGIVEVLGRLRELLGIRQQLLDTLLANPPDVFIGIDSPDFVLPVAKKLRQAGIKTVHYVSPSVWAWRQGRVRKIREAVDLMLTLFPFEAKFYEQHQVPVTYVGHPLASMIHRQMDHERAKTHWGYDANEQVVAVLPGSRGGELKHLGPLFIDVMRRMYLIDSRLKFIMPIANPALKQRFVAQLADSGAQLPITLIDGHAREVMAASDAVLVTSGTATLEAMLLKRPMVVAYKWGVVTHAIISRMVKTPYISLPNILADEELVAEFVQEQARADLIATQMMKALNDRDNRRYLVKRFDEIHDTLQLPSSKMAADAILDMLMFRLD